MNTNTNKNNTMFVHFHNVLKHKDNVVVSSSYIISDIQIRNNKVGREVNLIPSQNKKSVGKMLTSVGVPSNTSLGKYMRERVAQAITTECGGCSHELDWFWAGIENVGGTTRVWIFNADYDNKTKKLYGFVNMIEGKVVDGRSVTTLHKEHLVTHRMNSKYTSEGRSFRPYVTKKQDHTTMTHHLELDRVENRGGDRVKKVKTKLTATSTAREVKAAVIENIEVTNHNADVVSEVVEAVEATAEVVSELKASIELQQRQIDELKALIENAGIKVPAPLPVGGSLDRFFVDGPAYATDALDCFESAVSDRAANDPNISSVTRFQSHKTALLNIRIEQQTAGELKDECNYHNTSRDPWFQRCTN